MLLYMCVAGLCVFRILVLVLDACQPYHPPTGQQGLLMGIVSPATCIDHPGCAHACLQVAVDINRSYQQLYSQAKAELAEQQPAARQLALNEKQIFSRLELLAKRLDKLIKMFTTIHQFSSLEQHTHITGGPRPDADYADDTSCGMPSKQTVLLVQAIMAHACSISLPSLLPAGLEQIIKSFYSIVDDVKRKPYDLLDFSRTQYERDMLEFEVNIHDLEMGLQVGWLTRGASASMSLVIL